MNINPSWKYRDIIVKIWTLKTEYQKVLASFYYVRDRNNFMREVKQQIYALNFNENRKDEVWNELNRTGESEFYEEDFELDDRLL